MKAFVVVLLASCFLVGQSYGASPDKKVPSSKKIVPTHEFVVMSDEVVYIRDVPKSQISHTRSVIGLSDGSTIFSTKQMDDIQLDKETFRVTGYRVE